jgi:hypothetical protein
MYVYNERTHVLFFICGMQKKIEEGCEDESVERVRMTKKNSVSGLKFRCP